ncbi:MAG: hypothetical protein GW809_02125 [Bacteroidetes bacterium]|nr:hypothetical protein [Bacteroidota bacterium]
MTKGTQWWLTENVQSTQFSNGDKINQIGSDESSNEHWASTTQAARSVFPEGSENAKTFGYLYNFYTVEDQRNICREGWRVPSEDDWKTLEHNAGMPEDELD